MATAASAGSAGFCEPAMALSSMPPPEPKLLNRTLRSERFMPFAISTVSSVPAEPTTMPAIISTGFCMA